MLKGQTVCEPLAIKSSRLWVRSQLESIPGASNMTSAKLLLCLMAAPALAAPQFNERQVGVVILPDLREVFHTIFSLGGD